MPATSHPMGVRPKPMTASATIGRLARGSVVAMPARIALAHTASEADPEDDEADRGAGGPKGRMAGDPEHQRRRARHTRSSR